MAIVDDFDEEPQRGKMVVFVLVDCSKSMGEEYPEGSNRSKMTALNMSMEQLARYASMLDSENGLIQIDLAVLCMGVGRDGKSCEWMEDDPIRVYDFEWRGCKPEGCASMSDALEQLRIKMSRSEYLNMDNGLTRPVVIILTDGESISKDVETCKELENLKRNEFFKMSLKAAAVLGHGDVDTRALESIVGSKNVYSGEDAMYFTNIIKLIVLHASTIVSTYIEESNGNDAGMETRANDLQETFGDMVKASLNDGVKKSKHF